MDELKISSAQENSTAFDLIYLYSFLCTREHKYPNLVI